MFLHAVSPADGGIPGGISAFARHTLCHGTKEEVRREVIECLKMGQKSPGGHILHASHSVHEDVKVENYHTVVNTYCEYFGMAPLPG